MTTTDLTVSEPRPSSLVSLVATPQEIVANWKQFQELKKMLLDESDYQTYNRNGKEEKFIKKSGWRKFATAFGITLQEIASEEKVLGDSGDWIVIIKKVRATAPNGRFFDGIGSCDSHEDKFEETVWEGPKGSRYKVPTGRYTFKYNDLTGTAYTRAANRAISDLVGGGEVSAEEVVNTPIAKVDYLSEKAKQRLLEIADGVAGGREQLLFAAIFMLTTDQGKEIAEKLKQLAPAQVVVDATPVVEKLTEKQEKAIAHYKDLFAKAEDIDDLEDTWHTATLELTAAFATTNLLKAYEDSKAELLPL